MKVYALLIERAIDMEYYNPEIPIISASLDEVMEHFHKIVDEERKLAKRDEWEIEADDDGYFEAYEEGYYYQNHVVILVIERELGKLEN